MVNNSDSINLSIEQAVRERYSKGAKQREAALCCPVEYDKKYLEALPQEILDRDYGCGDPSAHVREGDIVLDLGSGGGKICYIAAQIVGKGGKVIGVDMNDEMLGLARKYQSEMQKKFGVAVEFHRGKIQDLALDMNKVEEYLKRNTVQGVEDLQKLEEYSDALRHTEPMIKDNSVDVIVSNCVLNLVREEDRRKMFGEMFRVLKRGGRVAISDIVSDEDVPVTLKNDADLWSGCISGAFTETGILEAFKDAGFYGMNIVKRDEKPWQTVEGIEFRSVTIVAYKGKEGECLERNQAVIYKGPWKTVVDDDGHTLHRGARMAVCDKTYHIYTNENGPYASQVTGILPLTEIPIDSAQKFNCKTNAKRHPRETKGMDYKKTELSDLSVCGPDGCC
ncbi:MAG TPA: methyltransferase domain-containing protein [Bacteroidota bacterium]